MIDWIKNIFIDRTFGAQRSSAWPTFRRLHIKDECEYCGTTYFRELHHCVPVHVDQSKELDIKNVVTLCRRCHLLLGHLGSWFSYNLDIKNWILVKQTRP